MLDDDVYEEVETARRMAEAARALLDSLDSTQRAKATLVFDNDDERTDWHYIPRDRKGLPIKEMDGSQRVLAHKLVASGLSTQAHDRARKIMALEEVLAQLEGDGRRFIRDQEFYYVSIFGDPGDDGLHVAPMVQERGQGGPTPLVHPVALIQHTHAAGEHGRDES